MLVSLWILLTEVRRYACFNDLFLCNPFKEPTAGFQGLRNQVDDGIILGISKSFLPIEIELEAWTNSARPWLTDTLKSEDEETRYNIYEDPTDLFSI